MAVKREGSEFAGFGRSEDKTFVIGSGANGSAVDPVNLGRNYAFIVIKCENCTGIASSTNMRVQAGYSDEDTLCDVYETDTPGTRWNKGSLPTSGTFAMQCSHAAGAQRLRIILSNNTSGAVTFKIFGWDGGLG